MSNYMFKVEFVNNIRANEARRSLCMSERCIRCRYYWKINMANHPDLRLYNPALVLTKTVLRAQYPAPLSMP